MSRTKQATTSILLSLSLAACGGGGGEAATTARAAAPGDSSGSASPAASPSGASGASQTRALSARFNAPWGIAADGQGNLYVADSGNATVRKITPAGDVSTVAGTAGERAPFTEEPNVGNGVGTAARFNLLSGITVDGTGTLYVGDTVGAQGRIRKILPDGTVSTLLANVYALGLASDGADGVYVAANGRGMNRGVLRISSDGAVTTLAALAGRGIARDMAGNLYIANTGLDYGPLGQTAFSCTIVTLASSGTTTVLAGKPAAEFENTCGYADGQGGAARFAGSESVAIDSDGNLYIADTNNHVIRKVSQAGVATTVAGTPEATGSSDGAGAAARFNAPKGITIDATGNLYVADTGNHTIRKVTAAGIVTTIAGAPAEAGSADVPGSR